MERLFAAHFSQNVIPADLVGKYDPEQGLWMADNQLQGVKPLATQSGTNTANHTSHCSMFTADPKDHMTALDTVKDSDTTSDGDSDSDNP